MKRSLPASFLLALALLCLSEIVVRVFFARNMSGRFDYGYHPTSGFQEKADGMVSLVRTGGRRFWPQTFSRKRPAGTFRILVIGDSVPRGAKLNTSYPWLIGEQMRAQGIRAESFNLSVPGNGAHRNQIVLRQALQYQPSLVILHVNNSNEFEDERDFMRREEFKSWHPKNWLMKSLVLRRLFELKTEQLFWRWLPPEIRSQKEVSDADAQVTASMDEQKLREWDERVKKFTTESVALARQRGVAVLLITQVRLERDAAGKAYLDDHNLDAIVSPLAGDGVYFLSMKKLLQPLNFEPLFADGAHLFPPGHEIIAKAVVEQMKREGLVAVTR